MVFDAAVPNTDGSPLVATHARPYLPLALPATGIPRVRTRVLSQAGVQDLKSHYLVSVLRTLGLNPNLYTGREVLQLDCTIGNVSVLPSLS